MRQRRRGKKPGELTRGGSGIPVKGLTVRSVWKSAVMGVSCTAALASIVSVSGCGGSDSEPVTKFEKPAGYKDSGGTAKPDDVFKRQRQDRGDDGAVKPGRSKAR